MLPLDGSTLHWLGKGLRQDEELLEQCNAKVYERKNIVTLRKSLGRSTGDRGIKQRRGRIHAPPLPAPPNRSRLLPFPDASVASRPAPTIS